MEQLNGEMLQLLPTQSKGGDKALVLNPRNQSFWSKPDLKCMWCDHLCIVYLRRLGSAFDYISWGHYFSKSALGMFSAQKSISRT